MNKTEGSTLATVPELRRLLAEATKRPWEIRGSDDGAPMYEIVANGLIVGGFFEVAADGSREPIDQEADAYLIVATINALDDLLDAAERDHDATSSSGFEEWLKKRTQGHGVTAQFAAALSVAYHAGASRMRAEQAPVIEAAQQYDSGLAGHAIKDFITGECENGCRACALHVALSRLGSPS